MRDEGNIPDCVEKDYASSDAAKDLRPETMQPKTMQPKTGREAGPAPGGAMAAAQGPAGGGGVKVLLGDGSVLALAHGLLVRWARLALEGAGPVVLDCGGFFDVYRLGVEARRCGVAPGPLLERIQICRAFTGYQEIRALLNLRRRFEPGRRIVLLNPLEPLLDEDLPAADRPWLLRRLLDGMAWYGRNGYLVRVCQRSVAGHALPEAAAFEATLARRFPLLVASRGRIAGAKHGQEHHPLFPRGGPGGGGVLGLPPGADAGRSGALRHVVQLRAAAHAGGRAAERSGPLPHRAAGHADRTDAAPG